MSTKKHINIFIGLTRRYFKTYLGIAISIILFIQFFQPFTIEKFDFENKLLFIAGFGLIILFFLLVSQIIFQKRLALAENESQENSLFIPLYFFTQIATSSLGFIFYIRYVGEGAITFNTVVKVIFICMSLPITVNLENKIKSYQSRLRKQLLELRELKEKLKQFSEKYTHTHIELISENESDNFRILVSEIIYIKSADNYVEIGFNENGVMKKKMLRSTLRKIEQQLHVFNNFIRTHRTSIVNIQYINKLNKNFNTYWLSLDNTNESIPVSRQYLMAVKDLL